MLNLFKTKDKNTEIKNFVDNKLIGRFAALSVANQVIINSFYNGIAYKYLMYKNGDEINIDKVSEKPTEEAQGLEVIACDVKFEHSTFKKTLFKLAFFETLHVEYIGKSSYMCDIVNTFNKRILYESPKGTFSKCGILSDYGSECMIRLGKVLYPYNQEEKVLSKVVGTRVVVNVNIGDVQVTPNREDLRYTTKTIMTLEKRFQEAKDEIIHLTEEYIERLAKSKPSTQELLEIPRSYAHDIYLDKENKYSLRVMYSFWKSPLELQLNNPLLTQLLESLMYKEIRGFTVRVYNRDGNLTTARMNAVEIRHCPILIIKDKICRKPVINYFIGKYRIKSTFAVILEKDLPTVIAQVKQYLFNSIVEAHSDNRFIKTCINKFINNFKCVYLSYDALPEEYKTTSLFEESAKAKPVGFNVRYYHDDKYEYLNFISVITFIDYFNSNKGLVIYTTTTKDDDILRRLEYLLSQSTKFNKTRVISVPKNIIPFIPKCRKYVSLLEFLTVNNTIMSKIAAIKWIKDQAKTAEYRMGTFSRLSSAIILLPKDSDLAQSIDYFISNNWIDWDFLLSLKTEREDIEIQKAIASMEYMMAADFREALVLMKYGLHRTKAYISNPFKSSRFRKNLLTLKQFLK